MTSHPYDVHAGKQLCKARRQRSKTQTDIADALGISFQQVQKYETGSNRISFSKLVVICQTLKVSPMHFFIDLNVVDTETSPIEEAQVLSLYRGLPEYKRDVVRQLMGKM